MTRNRCTKNFSRDLRAVTYTATRHSRSLARYLHTSADKDCSPARTQKSRATPRAGISNRSSRARGLMNFSSLIDYRRGLISACRATRARARQVWRLRGSGANRCLRRRRRRGDSPESFAKSQPTGLQTSVSTSSSSSFYFSFLRGSLSSPLYTRFLADYARTHARELARTYTPRRRGFHARSRAAPGHPMRSRRVRATWLPIGGATLLISRM